MAKSRRSRPTLNFNFQMPIHFHFSIFITSHSVTEKECIKDIAIMWYKGWSQRGVSASVGENFIPVGEFLTENYVFMLRKIPSVWLYSTLSGNLVPHRANPGANSERCTSNLSLQITLRADLILNVKRALKVSFQ